MDRSNWDRKEISMEVAISAKAGTESLAAEHLNREIKNVLIGSQHALSGVHVVARNKDGEKRQSFDLDIIVGEDKIGAIEVECGWYQKWETSLHDVRSAWPIGLSVLYRKVEKSDQSDFFLKINKKANSMFGFHWKWFHEQMAKGNWQIQDGGILRRDDGTRIPTCEKRIPIPWAIADKAMEERGHWFSMDDWSKFAKMICKFALEKPVQPDSAK